MECPQGMTNVGNNDFVVLYKCIHGLFQAGRQSYTKVIEILKKTGLSEAMLTEAFM